MYIEKGKMGFKKTLLICCIWWFCLLFRVVVATVPKISADFANIKTIDLLRILTDSVNKNVVISEKVSGSTSVKLHNIFWQDALDVVLQMEGLIKYETKNTIVIVPLEDGDKNIKTDLSPQILIEARIVSIDDNFIRSFGLDLHNSVIKKAQELNKGLTKIDSGQGQFNLIVTKFNNNTMLDLELNALESKGCGKVISKPKLLTANRKTAYIESGAEIPYQEKSKEGNTSIAFKKAVLSLKVTPEVVENKFIHLSLELNQDKIGQLMVNGVPTIDTRKIDTKVLVQDQDTVILGGIYEWSKNNVITGVPILSHIPVIKYFFRKKETKMERKELLIFVTPKIV